MSTMVMPQPQGVTFVAPPAICDDALPPVAATIEDTTTNVSPVVSPAAAVVPQTFQQFAFRAALALNNMAVTMMTRSCYCQAFETLKDAAMIMTARDDHEDEDDDEECCLSQVEIGQRLQAAHARVARPEYSQFYLPLYVVSHATRLNSRAFAHWTTQSLHAYTLIRIESEEVAMDQLSSDESHLPSAIILYNLAIAALCQSRMPAGTTTATAAGTGERVWDVRETLTQVAHTNLNLARNIVSLLFSACDDPFVMLRVIFVKAIVLRTLFQALREWGQLEAAKSCVSTLVGLERLAHELVHLDQIQLTPSAPAA